jgi:L-threonylcarbamoyladenylate synthase
VTRNPAPFFTAARTPGRPAVFLDRDGTLIEDRDYLADPARLEWFPDTFRALRLLVPHFALFVVTNQPGIAQKILTLEEVVAVNRRLVDTLAHEGVRLEAVYVCPHERKESCRCIKPNEFFLREAAREHGIDLHRSFVVGDHPHDVHFARAGGAEGVYLLTGHGRQHREELGAGETPVAESLLDAARWILARAGLGTAGPEGIDEAAGLLRSGGLVAFPTETVYGLGANALDERAVARVFHVKARPRFDPLIVHLGSFEGLNALTGSVPEAAERLAERFWPGPLTLVLPKAQAVPEIVTAGLPTVAVRVPDHPLALELLGRAEVPVAAPSANPFGRVSPTTAAHVVEHLAGDVDLILDGGPCRLGVESTVVSLAGPRPVLLRAGGVALEELEEVLGRLDVAPPLDDPDRPAPQAPGALASHYAPRTRLRIARRAEVEPGGRAVGLLAFGPGRPRGFAAVESLSERGDPLEAAANLFRALHRLDRLGLEEIVAEPVPERGVGRAVMDRLRRAAAGR